MTADKRKRGGPRLNRMSIPPEVVPRVDELLREGHFMTVIARALGCTQQTIRAIKFRRGAYARVAV